MAKKRATAAEIKERIDMEIELSKRGWGIEAISKEVGVTHQQVSKDLRKRLRETADTEDAEELRTMMNMRLTDLIQAKYEAALDETGNHQEVSNTLLKIFQQLYQINGLTIQKPSTSINIQNNYLSKSDWQLLSEAGYSDEEIEIGQKILLGEYSESGYGEQGS
tara:strand:- start:208 stop:699 length:492 start_codon:yes stop_codon:yes gene_type:complete